MISNFHSSAFASPRRVRGARGALSSGRSAATTRRSRRAGPCFPVGMGSMDAFSKVPPPLVAAGGPCLAFGKPSDRVAVRLDAFSKGPPSPRTPAVIPAGARSAQSRDPGADYPRSHEALLARGRAPAGSRVRYAARDDTSLYAPWVVAPLARYYRPLTMARLHSAYYIARQHAGPCVDRA